MTRLLSRRDLLSGVGGLVAAGVATSVYGIGIEPLRMPRVQAYAVTPPGWSEGMALRIGVMADLHACLPWMSAERLYGIAQQVNALQPDLIVVLGDFNAGHRFVSGAVLPGEWGEALSILQAPLGVFAVLGNHDWWHGPVPGMSGGPQAIRKTLTERRITLLENEAVPLAANGKVFWLAGLADQMAHRVRRGLTRGADDLAGTLKQVSGDAPILLLAHEPYIFPHVPERISLTLSGHTHGGQVYLPGIGAPWSPSRRYRYGHYVERDRHLIVSAGLGESGLPVRIAVPPEIGCIDVGGAVQQV